jgi:hypothetical protein
MSELPTVSNRFSSRMNTLRVMRLAKAVPTGLAVEKDALTLGEEARGMGRWERALALVSVLKTTGACRAHETCSRKPAIAQRFLLPRQLRPPAVHS